MPTFRVESCYLVVRGDTYPVSGFTVRYPLNNIPVGEALLPLGRQIGSGLLPNTYRLSVSDYGTTTTLRMVITELTGGVASTYSFEIFVGYITGVEYVYTEGQAHLKVKLTHWLADLAASSIYNDVFTPRNPKILNTPIDILVALGQSGGFDPITAFTHYISYNAALSNFWSNAIVPLLSLLLACPHLDADTLGLGLNDSQRRAAYQALHSYAWSILTLDSSIGPFAMELSARMVEFLYDMFSANTVSFLQRHSVTSVWAKLLDFTSIFLFSLIPFPRYYAAAPVIPGLANYYTTIDGSEIVGFYGLRDRPDELVRTYGVFTGFQPPGEDPYVNPGEQATRIGGWYVSTVGEGKIKVGRPPAYLELPYTPSRFANQALGVGGLPPRKLQVDGSVRSQKNALLVGHATVLAKLARYYYVIERIKNRTANIVCPFRGDICPGSTIVAVLNNTQWVPDVLDATTIIGTVLDVTYQMTPGRIITTTYTLGGVRAWWELLNPDFVLPTHPLYVSAFVGLPHLPGTLL